MASRRFTVVLVLVALVVSAVAVGAQVPPPPASPSAPPEATAGGSGAWTVFVALFALFVVVAAGVKFYDLRRKREAEAVHLQAQISDTLLRDQALFGLPVTPTVQIPTWRGSPAVIEVSGQVPTPEVKASAMRLVEAEARRVRPDFRIEDRVAVVPAMARQAA
jgi:hypothetical protein